MRSGDQPFPSVVVDDHPDASRVAQRLRIAVELLPSPAYVWDDSDPSVVWNADALVWDAPFVGSGFTDVTCDFQALTIMAGNPDEHNLVDAARLELSLANPTGEYSTIDAAGRLVFFAVGRRIAVWAHDPADGSDWWLFSGRITRWDVNPDESVTVEAFDGFAQLSPDPGRPWSAGAAGDLPGTRLAAIAAMFAYTDPTRFAVGDAPLLVETIERSALEEMEVVALSDAGVLYCDQDGTLVYADRTWIGGRTDQTVIRYWSDNICTGPNIVWDLEQTSNDDQLATTVTLTNTAGVTRVATSTAPPLGIARNYTHPERDLWTSSGDGDAVAGAVLFRHEAPTIGYTWTLYPLDPHQPDLFRAAVDLRLGDVTRFARTQIAQGGGSALTDLSVLVRTISHDITPDQWIAGVSTSKAVAYHAAQLWDATRFVWDQDDPANVWSV